MCGNLANRQPEEEGIMMTFTTVYHIGERLQLEGETENMGVWTKKRGSMNAVVFVATPATPCPKSLHGKGEKWIARNI